MALNPQKVIDIALAEVGYLEKKSNSNLDNKTANAGSNNYTKYGRDLDAVGFYNGKKNGVNLPDGTYEVYKWAAGENKTVSNPAENEWTKVGEIKHNGGKKIKFTYTAKEGELVDNFLFKLK
jgi:hypothetical protein